MSDQVSKAVIDISRIDVLEEVGAHLVVDDCREILEVDHNARRGLKDILIVPVLKVILRVKEIQLVLNKVDVALLPVLLIALLVIEHFI